MEEKKTFKIKKPYVIIITLAIVFAIMGFIDLKVNAAELEPYSVTTYMKQHIYKNDVYSEDDSYTEDYFTFTSSTPLEVFIYNSHKKPVADESVDYNLYVVSSTPFQGNYYFPVNSEEFSVNGKTFYLICQFASTGFSDPLSGYVELSCENDVELNTSYTKGEFVQHYADGTLDKIFDYSELQVDDDMATIKNLKRNVIELHNDNSLGATSLYDYLTWDNEMVENWELELQIAPVVQYYKISLSKNTFIKEFVGDWTSKEIFAEVTNKYLNKCYDLSDKDYAIDNYDIYKFYTDCNDKYSKGMFEESYIYYGYRFRYIDKENLKCSPWVVLMPSNVKDSYDVFVEYSDSSITDNGSGDGIHNKYDDLENLDDAMTDVDTENKFIEEYGPTISNGVNVDEATNWLQSVATFIKGTPAFVGSVLSFLPQPILYGIYICIFLSVIAGGYAIVKALI